MRLLVLIAALLTVLPAAAAAQSSTRPLDIVPLTGDFYIYTTYSQYKGSRVSANGMYLVTNNGVLLFDSPWDTTQFGPLLDSIRARHGQEVVLCLATHFHEDRSGGLEYYRTRGIATYTTRKTDSLSAQHGMPRAQFLIDRDTVFTVGRYSFQTYYPGPGHAPDNIVVWFEKERILYGGCLIKSANAHDLGNLGDASVQGYAAAVENVRQKCRCPKYIVTGHNDWRNTASLRHTLRLARQLRRKEIR